MACSKPLIIDVLVRKIDVDGVVVTRPAGILPDDRVEGETCDNQDSLHVRHCRLAAFTVARRDLRNASSAGCGAESERDPELAGVLSVERGRRHQLQLASSVVERGLRLEAAARYVFDGDGLGIRLGVEQVFDQELSSHGVCHVALKLEHQHGFLAGGLLVVIGDSRDQELGCQHIHRLVVLLSRLVHCGLSNRLQHVSVRGLDGDRCFGAGVARVLQNKAELVVALALEAARQEQRHTLRRVIPETQTRRALWSVGEREVVIRVASRVRSDQFNHRTLHVGVVGETLKGDLGKAALGAEWDVHGHGDRDGVVVGGDRRVLSDRKRHELRLVDEERRSVHAGPLAESERLHRGGHGLGGQRKRAGDGRGDSRGRPEVREVGQSDSRATAGGHGGVLDLPGSPVLTASDHVGADSEGQALVGAGPHRRGEGSVGVILEAHLAVCNSGSEQAGDRHHIADFHVEVGRELGADGIVRARTGRRLLDDLG
eukprot:1670020-Rhodomonas_salina.1